MKIIVLNIFFWILPFSLFAASKRDYSLEKIKREMYCGKEKNKSLSRVPINLKEMNITIPSLNEMFSPEQLKKLKRGQITHQQDLSQLDVRQFVDLSDRDTPVKTQWGGTCTAFGLVALVENLINNPSKTNLSENHLWSHYRQYNVDSAINAFSNRTVTTEEYWPQTNSAPYVGYLQYAHTKILSYRYIGNNLAKAIQAINENRPVYIGMTTSNGMYRGDAVIDPCTAPTSGGHAFSLVGYKLDKDIMGGGYFILKNSWGKKNGDNGYQYMPFNHCTRSDFYCFMYDIQNIQSKNQDPDPDIDPKLPEGFNSEDLVLDTKFYNPWYSSKNRLKIKILLPDNQKELIDYVAYFWNEEGKRYTIESDNHNHDFYQKLKLKGSSYTITVILHFKNGTLYSLKKNITL